MAQVVLKPGHVRPIHTGHPWVFKQAIARVEGGPAPGEEVAVVDPSNRILGRGFYSPASAIPVRLFTQEDRPVDADLIRGRFHVAVKNRHALELPSDETNAYRLVHGEGDALPGLIVDVLGDVVCVQLNTFGIKQREGLIFDCIQEALRPRAILDRTSALAAKIEGVAAGQGVVRGRDVSELTFKERGFEYVLPLEVQQKTGFYMDQRSLRARVEKLARYGTVLDAYSFVGSFALAAARGGAKHVTAVDQSAIALEVAGETAIRNNLRDRIEVTRGDALAAFEDASKHGGMDLVLCDPPKLAPSKAKLEVALTGYRKIARAACRATKPGGLLVFSSCSGAVGLADLTRALAFGARDDNLRATVLEQHIQAPDHPVPAAFPEGLYLKSLIARIDRL